LLADTTTEPSGLSAAAFKDSALATISREIWKFLFKLAMSDIRLSTCAICGARISDSTPRRSETSGCVSRILAAVVIS
jgi:hypothetical protein